MFDSKQVINLIKKYDLEDADSMSVDSSGMYVIVIYKDKQPKIVEYSFTKDLTTKNFAGTWMILHVYKSYSKGRDILDIVWTGQAAESDPMQYPIDIILSDGTIEHIIWYD